MRSVPPSRVGFIPVTHAKEHGKLVYSFDIRNAKGTITEVQVSAITGRIVRIEHESKKQEEAEKKEKH